MKDNQSTLQNTDNTILSELWADYLAFNWETVIIAAMEHLTMPAVILIIALKYRSEITALLGRLKNLKSKNFSAEFAELEKASEEIEEVVAAYKTFDSEDLKAIARIKPTAAVVEA